MYCRHCGTQLPEGGRFCPNCGAPVGDTGAAGSTTTDSATDNAQSTGSFEQQFNDFGSGIKDAAQDVKDGFTHAEDAWKATGDEFEENRRAFEENLKGAGQNAGAAAEEFRRNWRDYLTPENIERFAACALIFPFALDVSRAAVACTGSILTPLSWLANLLSGLLLVVFVLCSILAVGAGIYTVAMNEDKQTAWGWAALAGDVVAFLSVLCHVFRWSPIDDILLVLTLLYGIVLIGHVLVRDLGIETPLEVGADLGSYKQFYDDYKAAHPSEYQSDEERIANDPHASYFDGTGWSNLGYCLLIAVVGTITCGIATPWMLCKKWKWEKQHTVIEGRRLDFNGSGASLLGHWILWEVLTVITCGIYGFFMYVAVKKWEMKHTYYQDTNIPVSQGTGSLFDGNSFQYFGYGILQTLLILLTCGIGAPWAMNLINKWEARHEVISGERMSYDGSALGLFMQYIIVFLLSIITCCIYLPWAEVRLLKYRYRHYHVQNIVDAD